LANVDFAPLKPEHHRFLWLIRQPVDCKHPYRSSLRDTGLLRISFGLSRKSAWSFKS